MLKLTRLGCTTLFSNTPLKWANTAVLSGLWKSDLVRLKTTLAGPTPPLTPYQQFVKDNFAAYKKNNPNFATTEIFKLLGTGWKDVEESIKIEAKAEFEKRHKAYKEEAEKWKQNLSSEDLKCIADDKKVSAEKAAHLSKLAHKRAAKESGKPKIPMNTFMAFLADQRQAIREANPDLSMTELTKLMSEKYKNLNPQEKEVYQKAYEKDRERYLREKESYKSRK